MSQPCELQAVAVAHRPALRERVGQPLSTPALVGYPSSVHASRPLRSSPLAGPAFSSNPSIASSESSQSQSPSAFSIDVGSYSRSPPSSIISHTGSISATTSSHAHRAPGPFTGPSKSAGAIPTLGLDARPYSRSPPPSVISHTGSASSSSSHAHRAPTTGPAKSTSSIPTLGLFRRQAKDELAAPPPTQAPFGHSRSASFPCQTVPPPAHVPQAYSPSVARPTSPKPPVSRKPKDNWMSSSPFGPASTPRFSRQSMSSQPIVMPLSAREYRRRKCASTMTNAVYSATSGSPANESMGIEGVNSLPHIIVSDSETSGPFPSVPSSGNRSSRRASSPSLPSSRVSHASLSQGSREPALSEKSSISTFFSLSSENETENAVITVVDPGITPRRRKSYPNPTQHHSRISLVGAVNRLSQMSVASGDTVFFDMDDGLNPRQRQISVTEDDGVLRRASSRRKKFDAPFREPLMADAAAEPTAPQERTRVVRILEAHEDSSIPVLDSRFSNVPHDREELVSGDISTERAASSESKVNLKAPGTSSAEAQARRRKKLTKSRTQSVQVPPTRLAAPSLPWIPRPPSPFSRGSAKQNMPNVSTSDEENVPQTEEMGDNGKENKRRGRRLTFQFIPSPSFHRRPKSVSGTAPSPDLKSPMRNDALERIPQPDSRCGTDGALSSLTGSATTITLLPPPPITSSSSVSSSAGNSTSSLTDGSSTTIGSRDTSATSINTPSLQTASRGAEYPHPKIPSNLKQSMVAQWNSDIDSDQQDNSRHASKSYVDPPNTSHDQELQESSSSFCTVTSYASLASYTTSGSAPAALDARNALGGSFCDHDQAPDPNVHPMWTVPMVTITAASPTAAPLRAKENSPVLHNPHGQPSFLAVPAPVPTSRSTARLRRPRPRPQTAPASPTAPHFPTSPTSKSPRATGASSGLKSMFRSLLGRVG